MSSYRLYTTADSLYFSRLLNLIGSIKNNSPVVEEIVVYDLGLNFIERFILKYLSNITLKVIPKFCDHWRDCYTWKTYVHYCAEDYIYLYLDAGNTVLKNLDGVYNVIESTGCFFVDQGQLLESIIPQDYSEYNSLNLKEKVIAAGNIGFRRDNTNVKIFRDVYELALEGMTLGYSKIESHRDKEGNNIWRNCELFRHDQSLLNYVIYLNMDVPFIYPHRIYASIKENSEAVIYNNRKRKYTYIISATNNTILLLVMILYVLFLDLYHILRNRVSRYC